MDIFKITVKTAGLLIGKRANRQSDSYKLIDHGLFQLSRDSVRQVKFVCQNKNLLELVLKCPRAFKKFALLRMRTTVYSRILQNYFDNFSSTHYTSTPYFVQIVAIIKTL